MSRAKVDTAGQVKLLSGNEAIARGIIEAGASVCSGYPGTPSSEIMGTIIPVAKSLSMYAEWATNEKVALEVAAAASFAGLRALAAMKSLGINVALDFFLNLNQTGVKGGLVLVGCDDPGALSSTNEQDSRAFAKLADIPLLEPATPQEAKDMTKWAFELSEKTGNICFIRSVTRVSHTSGNVRLGERLIPQRKAAYDTSIPFWPGPVIAKHRLLHIKLTAVQEEYESSPFNWYRGPAEPELLIITSGSCSLYTTEAVKLLDLEKSVGILKLGTTWPLPEKLVTERLSKASAVLVAEEVDPFIEDAVRVLLTKLGPKVKPVTIYGKGSGHIPNWGELDVDLLISALQAIFQLDYASRSPEYTERAKKFEQEFVLERELGFCPGCPHRASFWNIKEALTRDGRNGFVVGDIGCYTMGFAPTGYSQIRIFHCMGAGAGVASGFGQLGQFDFEQPVLAVCGDSTFYHTAMPALVNGQHNSSNFILVVLDNGATAMTGFQPHPGTNVNALGETSPSVSIEAICRAVGAKVEICDPFDTEATTDVLYKLLQEEGGTRVLIMRRKCALVRAREEKAPYKMRVDPEKCVGDACGCASFCTRVFRCPGLMWDVDTKKARIVDTICSGCGLCADICPHSAIIKEPA